MADIIQLLPDHVANQIAAGEVVQRPASVVKELLENAIDAGATTIKLIIKDAGKTLVQVIDNGKGMSVTDARLCFERHATSKIKSADDLFQIQTKGFRGEALASIAAVAHVELKTKQEMDEVGTCLTIEGSKVTAQDVVVTPQGTSVSVKNLFFNIPARRNFLKSNPVETRHIIDEFHRVALAHSQIGFVMYHNGNELFNLPASNYRQRVVNIFGNRTNEKLVPIEERTDLVTVSGFVIKPEFAKKTRGEQFFFVNDRFIKSPYLNHAVLAAFDGLLKDGMHPGYFLKLQVDPQSIDINIHPTKTEIKFDDEHSLYAILRSSIKHSLGQFNIAPILDFEQDNNLETPYSYKNKQAHVPNIEVDRNFNPFQDTGKSSSTSIGGGQKQTSSSWESLYVGLKDDDKENFSEVRFESEEVTPSMFDAAEKQTQTTYQLQNKYIVSPIKSGLLVIHQHKAHQRVLYEELLRNFTIGDAVSQQLLFPLTIHFSKQEILLLQELKDQLEATGFVFDKLDNDTVEVSGIPASIKESNVSEILKQLISDVANEVPDASFSQTDLLAKSLAKSSAIKVGTSLSLIEQEHLVNSLFGCKEPTVTPHNNPVFITLSVEDLDKKFI